MNNSFQCRLCADFKILSSLLHISQKEAANSNLEYKINECFHLSFNDTHLTKYICLICCDKVSSSFEFYEQVKKAQTLLQDCTDIKTDIKEEDNIEHDYSFDYVDDVLEEKDFKEEDVFFENAENKPRILSKLKDKQKKKRSRKQKNDLEPRTKRTYNKHPKREKPDEVDPDKIIDSAERSQIIRRVKDEWKMYKWKCSVCKEEQPSVDDLRTHFTEIHQQPPKYCCMKCPKIFESYYRFKRHNSKHWKEFNYSCPVCSRRFCLKKQYESHLTIHDPNNVKVKPRPPTCDEKKYVCSTCGKNYKTNLGLRNHFRNTHMPRPKYKCDICEKLVTSKETLFYHKKLHTGEGDFTCEQCGKNFSRGSSLKYHMGAVHSESKPYTCQHCFKAFKMDKLLKVHIQQVHSDEKPHACEVCGLRFHRKDTLKRHSTVHSGILPYECDYCKKKFRIKQLLKVHIRQHTGERPFSCLQCNHHFTDSSNYGKHMKGKHGILISKKDNLYRTNSVIPPQPQQQLQTFLTQMPPTSI